MKVTLSSYFKGKCISPMKFARCFTLNECRKAVLDYVDEFKVTKQTWSGGQVYLYGNMIGVIDVYGNFMEV